MKNQSLPIFIDALSKIWGPLTADLTKHSKQLLETLAANCRDEEWVHTLLVNKAPSTIVFHSEKHGFILQAHVEQQGDYSVPHDHGNGWVLYATVTGAVEMGVFHQVVQPDGTLTAVQKDKYQQRPGQCHVYLPGDIHDTTALQNGTLMLRLTSCDFEKEFSEGRLIRYIHNCDRW
ncbi:hypothetical protein [Pseudoalteromonas obscura]|uniref:Cysteine dioxygenase n=1 Tax=Pseudoalteromonas obscura TaxID=3048491 RepID=A0ABT7ELV7_9GAMM|nr:hypothetical protein [Pseudoalteromonas sp. P94(2023)]MDK2596041.1 hypothetical protein [Pseudoalteromonas sp. P94(2023)]